MKCKCNDYRCGWVGDDAQILRAPDPFNIDSELSACPRCREVGTLAAACDEPMCEERGTIGTPTPVGYRMTCFKHRPVCERAQGN
jgi:hypothetical protein